MNFGKKIEVFYDFFINHGAYNTVLLGLKNTCIIAVLGLIIGIVIGTILATIRVLPKNNIIVKILDKIAGLYVSLFRGTPIVVQLLVFYYVLMPLMSLHLNSVAVAVAVFGMNSGAYISEIMRAGILSVDPGQMEGGRAVGLSYSTTMMKIIIPQAVKNILPALGNEFITMIKQASLASVFFINELTTSYKTVASATFRQVESIIIAGLIYLLVTTVLGRILALVEWRMNANER